ncbi:MAG: IclR family transcriptional regulator [Deltaproteobacteria bacterium]|nr:IclR family transcriptional regulator [Deltaproteobacteria bacterium]
MTDKSPVYFSKTLANGLRILNLFRLGQTEWSPKSISKEIGINVTSVYRLINTFSQFGILIKDSQTKMVKLGPIAASMAQRILQLNDFTQSIAPLVDEVHLKYNITINVAMYHMDNLNFIYRREAENTLTFNQPLMTDQLYCSAMGKSILAFLPPKRLDRMIQLQSLKRLTQNTITDQAQLFADLMQVARKGYAVNREEYIKGLIAIAAPILLPHTKNVAGSVGFDSSTVEDSLEVFENKFEAMVRKLADKIAELIPKV